MNRSKSVFHRLFLVPVLLSLLLPLVACGGGPDKGEQVQQEAESPAPPPAEQNPGGGGGGGGKRGPRGHVTLTGALTFDGDTGLACGAQGGQGLELNFDQSGPAQVQVKVPTYTAAGNYDATVVVREGATERNGTAKIEIQTREMGKGKRTALSGTFNGTYDGAGGQGTVAGSFRRCVLRDAA